MSDNIHIEKLHDMVYMLECDAEFLFRYGDLSSSWDLFCSLNLRNQKRLIALALLDGSDDAKIVARFLMGKLKPRVDHVEDLFNQMDVGDRSEIENYVSRSSLNNFWSFITQVDRYRILNELRDACEQIGSLEVEEAYWILIPFQSNQLANWIRAVGGKDSIYNIAASTLEVGYQPDEEELFELLTAIRNSAWSIHVHNHPMLPWQRYSCLPSPRDIQFSLSWRSKRPELSNKMLFFVIQSDIAIEYGREQEIFRRWI